VGRNLVISNDTSPFFNIIKYILDKCNLWLRDTWIIGSGSNAHEAYKAISSERNLGLNIISYIQMLEHFPAIL
jgi:undecaprenyl-phosphate galactose phosphotransferase